MDNTEDAIKELLARQRIWECLLCYTRGVDRLDRKLLLSGFHPQAMIDQGGFKGGPTEYANWVLGHHADNQLQTQHSMTNHACEIDGDSAHAETYVAYFGCNTEGRESFAVGRYIDRLQYFDGKWLITDRVCTTEGAADLEKNTLLEQMVTPVESLAIPCRDENDPSYIRPLTIPREKK